MFLYFGIIEKEKHISYGASQMKVPKQQTLFPSSKGLGSCRHSQ
jgi:hypothetical protein